MSACGTCETNGVGQIEPVVGAIQVISANRPGPSLTRAGLVHRESSVEAGCNRDGSSIGHGPCVAKEQYGDTPAAAGEQRFLKIQNPVFFER